MFAALSIFLLKQKVRSGWVLFFKTSYRCFEGCKMKQITQKSINHLKWSMHVTSFF